MICITYVLHMSNFFLFFLNLTFYKRNNAKIILLIIFCFFIIIIVFLVSNSNFTKERRIYKHL